MENFKDNKGNVWFKYKERPFEITTEDGELLNGTATLIVKFGNYPYDSKLCKYVDFEHDIHGGGAFDGKGAKKYFETLIEKKFGKLKWLEKNVKSLTE